MPVLKVGSEILVNTATGNNQINPQITTLTNGGFVVTWQDYSQGFGGATGDSSSTAIKAQVFGANGAPVGTEILVNTATQGGQASPQITALADGGFVVTWTDNSQGVGGATGDSSSGAIKAQMFGADGAPVGTEILVNSATESDQSGPQITALADGGFVVTWRDFSQGIGGATGDGSVYAVKAQMFGANGTPVGTEILVNTATESNQINPRITALADGGFVITWNDYSQGVGGATGDSSSTAVKAQMFGADGAPVGTEILVNTATLRFQGQQQITALANGGFVVAWHDNSQGDGGATGDSTGLAIKAQVFGANGAPVGTEILVNTATQGDQFALQMTALADGGFVVTWQDYSQGDGGATGDSSSAAIKAQMFDANGVPVGTEILVNTATQADQFAQQITALADGGFVVTWQDYSQGVGGATGDSSNYAIKAQVFGANGAPVGTEILVNTATQDLQSDPQITALANGSFVVTWNDFSQGNGGATGDSSISAIKAQVFTITADSVEPTGPTEGGDTLNLFAPGYLAGFGGDDTMVGSNGDDVLYGNEGNDIIDTAAGKNTVYGGQGDDLITGRDGNDLLFGNEGNDTLYGSAGNDTIVGGQDSTDGGDLIDAGSGNNLVYGNGGSDTIAGGEGLDIIVGGFGADFLYGNQGNDILYGNQGDDIIFGGAGNDTVYGGQGNDTIAGGEGNDLLIGNAGADRFVFGTNSGADIIGGFSFADGDRLDLQGQSFTQGTASDGSIVLTLSGGGSITLAGVTTFSASFVA